MIITVWAHLSLAPTAIKNPVFSLVFPSEDALEKLMSLMIFAPGLLDVVQAATPPTIGFFESLTNASKGLWGVYALLLVKPRFRPKIYVGCGTHSTTGVKERFRNYDTGDALPQNVKRALDDGYTIVHKGLLCWTPMPIPAMPFPIRVLCYAIEATLSFVLWAMVSRTKDYGMPHLCPWSIEALEYDGCCNDTTLHDSIQGEEDGFSLEEIAAKQVELVARRNAAKRQWLKDLKTSDIDAFQTKIHQYTATAVNKRRKDRAKGRWACKPCGFSGLSGSDLDKHIASARHRDKVAGVTRVLMKPTGKALHHRNIAAKRYYCKICKKASGTAGHLTKHFKTKSHMKKMAAMKASTS
jgi:hypothetical protein